MYTAFRRFSVLLLILALLCLPLVGCTPQGNTTTATSPAITQLVVTNGEDFTLEVGNSLQLRLNLPDEYLDAVTWSASNASVSVSYTGLIHATAEGVVAVTAEWNGLKVTVLVKVTPENVEYDDAEKEAFYADYTVASCYEEAVYRSQRGLMSGSLTVPDQAPVLSSYQPRVNGLLIRNNEPYFADDNTYVVVNAYGVEVLRVYRGGGYITLEEVAAYVYAFGDVPANYVGGKNAKPTDNAWGEYLRLNHSAFSGDTSRYPYEPVLPDISGCGGDLAYYEIDIGTMGTDCDPAYVAYPYNDGSRITRGAARIVYARYDANGDRIIDPNERYLFYTYNHYNDFQEYLNYYGGWGQIFGNVTGGGTISSKTDCNPTPYVPTGYASFYQQ